MSETLLRVLELAGHGSVVISDHGYDELAMDGILAKDKVTGVREALVIEDYPLYPKGPCVLVLQWDRERNPIHVVWGIPRNAISPAVVVTAYRPDRNIWTDDFRRRRP